MRHVVGFLICLAFVSAALATFGAFSPLTKNSDASVGAVVQAMEAGGIQASVDHSTAPAPVVDTISPLRDLGHFVAIVISPVGALALGLYLVVIWALPAR